MDFMEWTVFTNAAMVVITKNVTQEMGTVPRGVYRYMQEQSVTKNVT